MLGIARIKGRLALWIVLPWLGLLLLKTLESWSFLRLQGQTFAFSDLLRHELPIAVVGMLVTPWGLWLGFRLPITRSTWRKRTPILVPAILATVLVMNVARARLWLMLGVIPMGGGTVMSNSFASLASVFHIDLINVTFMVALGHLLFFLRDRQAQALQAARLEAQLAEARLHVLQSRIQPHFLFNSLHTIGQLVRAQRNGDAMHVVERLGQLLRSALEERPALIPLGDEIEFALAYLEIESVRFSDRLRVTWDVKGAELERALVPALLLQPLIENAVRHGIGPHADAGKLDIRIERRDELIEISVDDDGHGFGERANGSAGTGVGLRNTRERLNAVFGAAASFETMDRAGRGARVLIRFPYTVQSPLMEVVS
jgi:hypothetical protein